MARKGGWFFAVKRVLSPDSRKDQKKHERRTKWFSKSTALEPALSSNEAPFAVAPPLPSIDTKEENEESKNTYSLAFATAVAAEAAVVPAQAAAEVIHLTSVPHYPGKTNEEIAAIKIQSAFRGYLARRTLHALRGLVRLKTLIQGHSVKRQAATTLRCMQTLARVQSQIRKRRISMSEENRALQQQLQRKLNKLQAAVGEEWDDSTKSKEQIDARLLDRKEAAMRRERALAYALSHQQTWKNPSKSVHTMFMVNNPYWGWSWLERSMASRPLESQSTMDHNDLASVKSAASRAMSVGEITKLYSLRDLHHGSKHSPTGQKSSRPPVHPCSLTPALKAPCLSSASGKARPPSLKGNAISSDDDTRSVFSTRSGHYRRHSIAGLSVRDDESLTSSPAFPSYVTPSKSAKVKSRMQRSSSPAGQVSVVSAEKRLSFPSSPARSKRHSCPPKVEVFSEKDVAAITGEEK